MPKMVPKACEPNSSRVRIGGSVIMFPTASPTTRLPAYRTAGVGRAAIAASAAAWIPIFHV